MIHNLGEGFDRSLEDACGVSPVTDPADRKLGGYDAT